MCDYSLHNAKTRDAEVGDKLVTNNFGTGTVGFCSVEEYREGLNPAVAVCVRPGTEISFEEGAISMKCPLYPRDDDEKINHGKVAVFAHISQEEDGSMFLHRDVLDFPDGTRVALNRLVPGQRATVLQLPHIETLKKVADEVDAILESAFAADR